MQIRMQIQRVMQDVGTERILLPGETYDLPDPIAKAFIATGAAEAVRPLEKVKAS